MTSFSRRITTGAILILFQAAALLGTAPWARAESAGVRVTLDGEEIPLDVPGEIREGRTLVPFRPIFEALGAEVTWDPYSQTVSAARGSDTVVLTIGSQVVQWRRSTIRVDVAPVVADGRTLVPLRFVGQALGLHVRWEAATRTVHLESRPDDRRLARGIEIVHTKSCMVCHTIGGAGGQVAPNLSGVVDRYGEEWLQAWLRNPQAIRSGSRMPNYRFTEDEIDSVITFLKTIP